MYVRKYSLAIALAIALLGARRVHAQTAAVPSSSPASSHAPSPAPSPGAMPSPAAAASPASSASPVASSSPAAATSGIANQLKTVVVTATRIAQPISEIGTTISVIDSEQIDQQKIEHVGTALREVPGVQVTQSGSPGSITDVSIRGATPAQTLVLIDGVEVNAGATGSFDFANLTTDNLDRIEVLRGAGGSLYGSQAIGGVVNMITPEGEGAPEITMLSEGGNRATERQVFTLSGSEGNLGYSGALSYFSTDGFRPANDSSDNLAGNVRLDYHIDDDTVVRGFARYSMSDVGLPNYAVFSGIPVDPTAHERSEFMLFKGEIEHRFGEKLVTRASAFYVRNEIRLNATPFTGYPATEIDRIPDETRGGLLEAVYTWSKGFRTLAGFDFKDRWVSSGSAFTFAPFPTSISSFHARRQEYAGYLEQEGSFFDGHLLTTGGFRVDGNSQFGKEVSPSWSVAIPITQISTTLRGSYSEGFRAPSFDELYFPSFGDPHLKPELSSEYDGGFTTTFGEYASLTTTYFSRRVHNLIVAVPCSGPGCPFGSIAGNAGRVDVQGVEVAPSVTPLPGLTFGGSVTVLDETHNAGISSARPLRVPKHSAQALLQYVTSNLLRPHDKVTASLAYTFVGDRDDITTVGTIANHDAYSRFDAVASYAMGAQYGYLNDEEVFARVENMLDRHYEEAYGFPAPPVNFVAGLKVDLQ